MGGRWRVEGFFLGVKEKGAPIIANFAADAALALAEYGGVAALALGDEVGAHAEVGVEAVIDFVEVERRAVVLQIDHDVGKAVG